MNALLEKLSLFMHLPERPAGDDPEDLRQGLAKVRRMKHSLHHLDLIDEMHGHLLNRNQYESEKEGLDYWTEPDPEYDALLQQVYVQPGNSYFRQEYEEILRARPVRPLLSSDKNR